jgi:RNA polymerase-binding protein DksA
MNNSPLRHKQHAQEVYMKLSVKELATIKDVLLEKRQGILDDLGDLRESDVSSTLKDASGENSAYSFHMADVGTDNMEREKAFFFATREGKYLKQVEQALDRIEEGTFGICVDCEQPIPWARLEAVPTATRCVPCKEKSTK